MSNNSAELREMLNESSTNSALLNNKLSARQRINHIFDDGTFVEIGSYIGDGDVSNIDNYGAVITGYGAVNGNLVFIFSQDYSRLLGAITPAQSQKIINIIRMAVNKNALLVGIFDSSGTCLENGLSAIESYGEAINELSKAKQSIYTIAAISGPCGGMSAVFASLFSYKIISNGTGSLYISPKTALSDKSITEPQASFNNGFVDFLVEDDASICNKIKELCYALSTNSSNDNPNRKFKTSLLDDPNYNIYDVINDIVDKDSFIEFNKSHAKSIIVGLAKINNELTAIVSTNHSAKDGKICECGILKAAKFIEKITINKLPVLTLVDVNGLNYGDKPELNGYPESLSRLVSAYSNYNSCVKNSITVILGEAYGTPYVVLGSKSLGTSINYALDSSKIGVINPLTAIEFLGEVENESNSTNEANNWALKNANPIEAARLGYVDDIIKCDELRQRIAAAIMMMKT